MTDYAPIHVLAKRVALLIPGWRYATKGNADLDGRPGYCAYIESVEGYRLCMQRAYGRDATRITIAAALPSRDSRGNYHRPDDSPSIGCDGQKAPELIARDIQRRLLPDLKRAHEAATKRIAEYNAHYETTTANAQHIREANIGTVHGPRDSSSDRHRVYLNLPDPLHGHADIDGASCMVEVRGLTAAQLITLARALGA